MKNKNQEFLSRYSEIHLCFSQGLEVQGICCPKNKVETFILYRILATLQCQKNCHSQLLYVNVTTLMNNTLFQGHWSNFCSLFSRIQCWEISKRTNGTCACSLTCQEMYFFLTLPSSLHNFLLSKLNAAVHLHINNVLMLTFLLYCFGDPYSLKIY